MSRSLRHGALAATAIVFSIASLAACGAGNDAATLKVRPDSAAARSGDISIQNANVITQPERNAEGPAVVSATLFNNGTKQQTLDAITLPGTSAAVQLHAAGGAGPVVVPVGGKVVLGGKGNASAVIEKGREAAQAGNVQAVVFKFSSTGRSRSARSSFRRPATSRASARVRCRWRRRPQRLPVPPPRRRGRRASPGPSPVPAPRTRRSPRPTPRPPRRRPADGPTYAGTRVPRHVNGGGRPPFRGRPPPSCTGRPTARTCTPGPAPSPGSAARPGRARSWRAGA